MHPFLFDIAIGGYHLRAPTYGLFLALAFSAAYFHAIRWAMKQELDPRNIEALFLGIVFSSVIGSRLFHVLFEEPSYYWANPTKIFALWEGGYTLYGAMLAAILALFLISRSRKIPFFTFIDIAAGGTALGIAIGRVGCFFAGCCWGRPCHLPWAVTFTDPESFTTARNVPLHPSQLYEAFAALLIFVFLEWRMRHRKYVGQLFFEGLSLYAIARFIVEYFRGDEYRGYILHGMVSYSQLVSLALLPFTIYGMYHFSRRAKAVT